MLNHSTVEFKVNGVRIIFDVLHNLPKKHGLSLSDAVDNWTARTTEFTRDSLCNYINGKPTGYVCIPATKKNIEKYFGKGVKITRA